VVVEISADIKISVVVEIAERHAAAHVLRQLRSALAKKRLESREPGSSGDVGEFGFGCAGRKVQF